MTKIQGYTGECLCGKSRYTIRGGQPQGMFLCHCSRCRKETGTVDGANVFFNEAQLIWERGEENLTNFTIAGTRHARSFCKFCGSPLPRIEGTSGVVLPAGGLDEGIELVPTAHIYIENRANWEDKVAEIPRFAKLP